MTRYLLFITIFISSLISQNIETFVVSKNIDIDQSFNFTIKIKDIDIDPEVDISPMLDNFSVIMGPNMGSEYKFINGKKSISRSISWTIIAKKPGQIKIPRLEVVLDGKQYLTEELTMNVSKKETDTIATDMFLKIEVSDSDVKIGEQVIVTYTFFTRIASKVLSTEFPKYKDFWVEKLFDPAGKQIKPEAWNDIEINGYKYKSIKIYEVALFPLSEGKFDLNSMIMKIETKEKDPGIRRLFWEDPFFDTFSQRTKARILVSEQKTINVSKLINKPKDFTGAVGSFDIMSSVSSDIVENGTPMTFYLKLIGEGNLSNIGRPIISFPDDFDIFDGEILIERNITDSVSGAITWEYNLIPRKEGNYIISAISIPFFDTEKESWNLAKSNPIKLNITKSAYIESNSKDSQVIDSKDIRYIKLSDTIWKTENSSNIYNISFFIILTSIFIFLAPLFIKPLNNFIEDQSMVLKNKSALSNALKLLKSSDSLYVDCPKAIRFYCKDKRLIDSINFDSLSLIGKIKGKIKSKDLVIVESILNECSQYNYADISTKDSMKIQQKTIKILNKIDSYV
ncbi:MAG: BatD family protein [Candidatus Marinimicrobia bacterium]|nr:BatD family protein [Candidatus Neomarinimicrobiota bacterium]